VDALSRMLEAVAPGGAVLDLQVIRPNPVIEVDGRAVAEIDGEPLFAWADAATAAIEARVAAGELVEEAVDDHDVRKHYRNGPELVDDVARSKRRFTPEAETLVATIERPLHSRERCRLRRLRVRCRGGGSTSV
jgi:hypothetical protein